MGYAPPRACVVVCLYLLSIWFHSVAGEFSPITVLADAETTFNFPNAGFVYFTLDSQCDYPFLNNIFNVTNGTITTSLSFIAYRSYVACVSTQYDGSYSTDYPQVVVLTSLSTVVTGIFESVVCANNSAMEFQVTGPQRQEKIAFTSASNCDDAGLDAYIVQLAANMEIEVDLSTLAPGVYNVCWASTAGPFYMQSDVNLTIRAPIAVSIELYEECDNSLGSAIIRANRPGLLYVWSFENGTQFTYGRDLTNVYVGAGSYEVVVSDDVCGSIYENFTITAGTIDDTIKNQLAVTPYGASCFGSSDGAISVTLNDDQLDVTLSVYCAHTIPSQTMVSTVFGCDSLQAGLYDVYVQRQNSTCPPTLLQTDVEISQPTQIVSNFSVTGCQNQLTITAFGGSGYYNAELLPNDPDQSPLFSAENMTFDEIDSGTYNLTVFDGSCLSDVQTIVIPQRPCVGISGLCSSNAVCALNATCQPVCSCPFGYGDGYANGTGCQTLLDMKITGVGAAPSISFVRSQDVGGPQYMATVPFVRELDVNNKIVNTLSASLLVWTYAKQQFPNPANASQVYNMWTYTGCSAGTCIDIFVSLSDYATRVPVGVGRYHLKPNVLKWLVFITGWNFASLANRLEVAFQSQYVGQPKPQEDILDSTSGSLSQLSLSSTNDDIQMIAWVVPDVYLDALSINWKSATVTTAQFVHGGPGLIYAVIPSFNISAEIDPNYFILVNSKPNRGPPLIKPGQPQWVTAIAIILPILGVIAIVLGAYYGYKWYNTHKSWRRSGAIISELTENL